MHTLEKKTFIKKPLSEVFDFFSKAENLGNITPPHVRFKILTPLPIKMGVGTLIDYQISLFRISFKWQTKITKWEMPNRFEDTQIKGPYKTWIHTHIFEEKDGGVWMTDIVKYESPGGFLEFIPHNLFVKRNVEQIFSYREEALKEIFK
jgi:ligand-binding SRPBCC domain-containing protein